VPVTGLPPVAALLAPELVQVVLPVCRAKQVPVLGLAGLEDTLSEVTGFRGTVLGFTKQGVKEGNLFQQLYSIARSAVVVESDENVTSPTVKVEDTKSVKTPENNAPPLKPKGFNKSKTPIHSLHLRRPSKSVRIFVPPHMYKEDIKDKDGQPPMKKKKIANVQYITTEML